MRLLLSASFFALMVGMAHAADVVLMPPAEPVVVPAAEPQSFDWSGVYAGGNVGYGWFDIDQKPPLDFPAYGFDAEGLLGGVQVGANVQHGQFVFGAEADYDWAGIEGSIVPDPLHAAATTTSVDIDWIATVRGRAGFAFDRSLLYGTGGIAFAHANASVTNFIGSGDNRTDDQTSFGWTVGGGGEFALSHNLTFKAEYLYFDFPDKTYTFVNPNVPPQYQSLSAEGSASGSVARIGFNYLFH